MVAQFYHKGTLAENVFRLWTAAVARIIAYSLAFGLFRFYKIH